MIVGAIQETVLEEERVTSKGNGTHKEAGYWRFIYFLILVCAIGTLIGLYDYREKGYVDEAAGWSVDFICVAIGCLFWIGANRLKLFIIARNLKVVFLTFSFANLNAGVAVATYVYVKFGLPISIVICSAISLSIITIGTVQELFD